MAQNPRELSPGELNQAQETINIIRLGDTSLGKLPSGEETIAAVIEAKRRLFGETDPATAVRLLERREAEAFIKRWERAPNLHRLKLVTPPAPEPEEIGFGAPEPEEKREAKPPTKIQYQLWPDSDWQDFLKAQPVFDKDGNVAALATASVEMREDRAKRRHDNRLKVDKADDREQAELKVYQDFVSAGRAAGLAEADLTWERCLRAKAAIRELPLDR